MISYKNTFHNIFNGAYLVFLWKHTVFKNRGSTDTWDSLRFRAHHLVDPGVNSIWSSHILNLFFKKIDGEIIKTKVMDLESDIKDCSWEFFDWNNLWVPKFSLKSSHVEIQIFQTVSVGEMIKKTKLSISRRLKTF
jgi:hypothetical protein